MDEFFDTDAEVARSLGICRSTLVGWCRRRAPSPKVFARYQAHSLRKRNWLASDISRLRAWMDGGRVKKQRLAREHDAFAHEQEQNASVEAKHLFRAALTRSENLRQVLRGIEFTARETALLKKSRGLGGSDFLAQRLFRAEVATAFLQTHARAGGEGCKKERAATRAARVFLTRVALEVLTGLRVERHRGQPVNSCGIASSPR